MMAHKLTLDGGGTLLLSQFNPGLFGSVDILQSNPGENKFAILPNQSLDFSPIDPKY